MALFRPCTFCLVCAFLSSYRQNGYQFKFLIKIRYDITPISEPENVWPTVVTQTTSQRKSVSCSEERKTKLRHVQRVRMVSLCQPTSDCYTSPNDLLLEGGGLHFSGDQGARNGRKSRSIITVSKNATEKALVKHILKYFPNLRNKKRLFYFKW